MMKYASISKFVEEVNPPYAQCFGKERFFSPKLAWSAKRKSRFSSINIYRCNLCGGWHLGSRK